MDDLKEKFKEYHKQNPGVYKRLVELTKQAHEKGKTRVGMKMLFEVVRWNEFLQTNDPDFKLNNNYTSYYARMIMHQHPEFGEIFETRTLRSHSDAEGISRMFPNVPVPEKMSSKEEDVDTMEGPAKIIEKGSGRKAVVVIR